MKIDVTTIFFNSNIDGGTATAPWCVSIGQGKDKKINNDIPGLNDVLDGLIYKSVPNREWVDTSAGSKNNEYLLISKFDKLFINGVQQESLSLIGLLVREHTKSHEGRLRISFPPYATYNDSESKFANQDTYQAISEILGCGNIDGNGGCWFVDDISVLNQDELHLSCIVVDPNGPKIYKTSQTRSGEWQSLASDRSDYEISRLPNTISDPLESEPLQQIFFGAPGTGKSFKINEVCAKYENYRTTFHPDTDYASFVGSYKPITEVVTKYDMHGHAYPEKRIVYTYVFQAFLKAYIAAWREQQNENPKPVFLVVEEINRGNCAQIFGDIFQLLDRNESGYSDYPIVADDDLAQELKREFEKLSVANPEAINSLYKGGKDVVDSVKSGKQLLLPNNLYIWATMNTSDQSLFPIDSAFKRRWDWKYIKIKDAKKDYKIVFSNGNVYDWWSFVTEINNRIEGGEIQQEDKKLGYFFAKSKDGIITADRFLSKVIFFLYNDVFKDFGFDEDYFKGTDGQPMTFASYFDEAGEANEAQIERFLNNLGLKPQVFGEKEENVEEFISDD